MPAAWDRTAVEGWRAATTVGGSAGDIVSTGIACRRTRNPGRPARMERPVRRVSRDPGGSTLRTMTNASGDLIAGGPALREAAARLARLGFLVVNGSHPEATGSAQLLVALRSQPTLEHFDPEWVEHWVSSAGQGAW